MNIPLLEQVSKMIEPLGWVLVHFLWQGTLIASGLFCLLLAQRRASATARYCSTLAALVAMTMMPFATLTIPALSRPFPEVQIVSTTISTQQESIANHEPIADLPATEKIAETLEVEPTLKTPISDPNIEITDLPAAVIPEQPQQIRFSERMRQAELQLRPWLKGVVIFWFLGVLLLSIRFVRLWNQVQQLGRVGIESVPEDMLSRLEELARRLGIRMRVNLLLSKLVEVPTLIGWLQPVILLPASAVTGLTPSQLDAILVHELAHIRRHDYLVNLLQSTVETLLFYHPAVWWISSRLRVERENCCDDLTVNLLGDPLNYGRALLALEEQRRTTGNPALVLGSQGGSLLGRIERLVMNTQPPNRRSSMGTSLSVLVGSLILGGAMLLAVRGEVVHGETKAIAELNAGIHLDRKTGSANDLNALLSDTSPSWKDNRVVAQVGKTEIQIGDLYLNNANLFKEFRQDVEELEKQPPTKERDDILHRKRAFLEKEIKQALNPAIEIRLLSLAMQDDLQTLDKKQAEDLEGQFLQGVWIPPKSYFEESGEDFDRYFARQLECNRANFYYRSKDPLTIFHDVPRLKEYHEAHLADFSRKPKVRWQAISIRSSNHGGKEPARLRAEEAFVSLSSGSSFEDAARKFSESVTASSGGFKGWSNERDVTEESLKKLLFELPVNEISTVTPVSDGWMIVRVLEREPLTLLPFDECQGEVKLAAERELQLPIYRKLIAESEQKHPVKVFYGKWKGLISDLSSPFESWLRDEVKGNRAEENNITDGFELPAEDSRPKNSPQEKQGSRKSIPDQSDQISTSELDLKEVTIVARVGNTEIKSEKLFIAVGPQLKHLRDEIEKRRKSETEEEYQEACAQEHQIHINLIRRGLSDAIELRLLSLGMQDLYNSYDSEKKKQFDSAALETMKADIEQKMAELKLSSSDELDTELRKMGYDPLLYRHYVEEQFRAMSLWMHHTSQLPAPAAEDVQKYYESHLDKYTRPEHIVWETVQFSKDLKRNDPEVQTKLTVIRSRLEKGGPLEEIAREYSTCISSTTKHENTIEDLKSFSDLGLVRHLNELRINEVSELIEATEGLQLIRLVDRQPPTKIPLVECQPDIEEHLKDQAEQVRYDNLIQELRLKYPVWTVVEEPPTAKKHVSIRFLGESPTGLTFRSDSGGFKGLYYQSHSPESHSGTVNTDSLTSINDIDSVLSESEDSTFNQQPEIDEERPVQLSSSDQQDSTQPAVPELLEKTVIARVADKEITVGDLSIPGFQIKRKIIEDLHQRPTAENLKSIAKLQSELLNGINKPGLISRIQYQLQLIGLEEHLQSLKPDEATALSESLTKELEERVRKVELRPEFTISRPISIAAPNGTHTTQRVLPEKINKMLTLILRMKRFREIKTGGTREPTEEELRRFFESPSNRVLQTNPRVKWQYVLIKNDQHGGQDASKLRAEEALAALKSGKRFDDVAEQYSDSVTASEGGHWGWSEHGSLSNSEIDNLLFEIPIGEVSDIQKVPEGWQIVKVLERQQSRRLPLEECRGRIRDILYAKEVQREQEEFEKLERHLEETYDIWTIFGDMASLRQQADTQNRTFLQDQFIEPHDYLPQAIWSSNVRGLRFSIDALRDDANLLKDEELPQSGWRIYARWKNVSDQPITLKYIPVRSTLKVDRGKSEFVAVIPLMPNPANLRFNPFSGQEIEVAPGEIINCPITYLQINTLNNGGKIPAIDETHSPISLPSGNYTLQVDHTFQDSEISGLESIIFQATTTLEVQEGKPAEIRVIEEPRKIEGT